MLVLLIPLLMAVGLYIAYFRSSASAARKRARNTVVTLETLDRETKAQDSHVRETISQSAKNYAHEVRTERLRAIPIDQLRRQASGLRLQALKQAGIGTLADLHGWSGSRLSQLRGVGPKSATTIAFVAEALTKQSNDLPIPYPLLPSQNQGGALMQAIYLLRRSQSWLPEKHKQLQDLIKEFRSRQSVVDSKTSFIRWLSTFGNHPDIQSAVVEAEALARELEGENSHAKLRAELSELLSAARTLQSNGIGLEEIAKDFTANQDDYVRILREQLGPPRASGGSRGTVGAVEPVAVSVRKTPQSPVVYVPMPVATQVPTTQCSSAVWVSPDREMSLAGFSIKGGMVYLGSGLPAVRGGRLEPALIDPALPVSQAGADCHVRMTNYWPCYDALSPEARASYLQWLDTGKCDPKADIGYVFLYFYGLERRALADAAQDPRAAADLPVVIQEIVRLLDIYGDSRSFHSYASSLLDYLTAQKGDIPAIESLPGPRCTQMGDISLQLRMALGLHARAARPLPAEWGAAWYLSAPNLRRGKAVTVTPELFASLFKTEFERSCGAGLKLPISSKTKIKVTHRAASLSLAGESFTANLDLPDISVLTRPAAKLQEIGDACSELLTPYSRYVSANPSKAASREALLLLPVSLWPDPSGKSLHELRDSISSDGQVKVMLWREVLSILPDGDEFNKVRFGAFARALGSIGLGIDPDVRAGGGIPGADGHIVLFVAEKLHQDLLFSTRFAGAELMIHMSALVASATGNIEDNEARLISDFIGSDSTILEAERKRLMARLQLYRTSPPGSAGLKKRIESLDKPAREAISAFLLQIALANGSANPEKVKVLENLFGLLGLDHCALYSGLHELEAHTASPRPVVGIPAPTPIYSGKIASSAAFQLDASKVAALRADSARVSALLGSVFSESDPDESQEPPAKRNEEQSEPCLLDLDTDHAGLLQVLLQRTQWTREELEELCADRGLMLDGAIERINDAAFTRFDQPLIEGEDPVEINCEMMLEEEETA